MGSELVDAFERRLAPVMAANNGSDVRMCGYTMCNGISLAKPRPGEDSYFRTQKYGICYNNALKRMNKLLTLLSVYIWIGVLFCCVHLGAANTTQEMNVTTVNVTTVELTTIIDTTELPEVTTELTTQNTTEGVEPWVYGVAAAGGVVPIVVIIIIIVCIKKRNSRRNPPAPVEKDLTSSQDGLDRDIGFSGGHSVNSQGDVNISMDNFGQAVEESIYQNTGYQSEAQDNLGFNHSLPDSPIDENFPAHPPPSPPRGAARNMDARSPLGIPSPFVAILPGLEPVSPLDDIPQRPPPAVPSQEAKDKTATKKKKDKKEKKKNDKPKAPQRYIDPNEQIREGIPVTTTSPPSSHPMPSQSMIAPKFDFRTPPSELDTGGDFGDNYEEMSPVDSNAANGWSPRQPAEDYGGDYEDVGGGGVNEDMDYDDDYEVMDPNKPGLRKPTGGKKAIPLPVNNLTGPRSPPNMNQHPMVLPPALSGGEDYGGEYEEMCPGESPTRRVPGGNIDNRPQIPIPHQDEEQDHGGEYELVDNPNISPKKKMAVPKPKTAKKPKPTPPGDFGQEYGNTGNSAMLPTSTTQRLPPSLPSSSTLPQTPRKLFKEGDDWLPPPPPELDQCPPATIPSPDNADYGGEYDDVEIKPPVMRKPQVPKPKIAKKPTNTGSSSTLPVSPKQQVFSAEPRSSATLPGLGEKESILEEDSTYMNLPSLKGDLSTHYRNLPSPQKTQEHVTSSGYTYFTERPK